MNDFDVALPTPPHRCGPCGWSGTPARTPSRSEKSWSAIAAFPDALNTSPLVAADQDQ